MHGGTLEILPRDGGGTIARVTLATGRTRDREAEPKSDLR
jgi:hypothetical protein